MGSIPGMGRSPGGGNGDPLQYSCLKKSHGQRSLAGYSPQSHKESDATQHTARKVSIPTPGDRSTLGVWVTQAGEPAQLTTGPHVLGKAPCAPQSPALCIKTQLQCCSADSYPLHAHHLGHRHDPENLPLSRQDHSRPPHLTQRPPAGPLLTPFTARQIVITIVVEVLIMIVGIMIINSMYEIM